MKWTRYLKNSYKVTEKKGKSKTLIMYKYFNFKVMRQFNEKSFY